jgi:hypothetical protein
MLEGKEVEVKIGEYGSASVDVTGELKVVASVSLEIDLIGEVKKLCAKTATPIDDAAIAWLEKLVRPSEQA